jgi:type VI secretion system secreted protein Hcp
MSDLEWQPDSPFTELEGEGGGDAEYHDELEYEDETRAPVSALSRMPVRIAPAAVVPQSPPAPSQSSQPAGTGAPKQGSTARLIPGLIFVQIQGATSGAFPGNTTQKGREGWIAASGFAHEVRSPRDAATGLSTGRRQHGPVTLTLPWSSASPILFKALVSNEVLTSVVVEFAGTQATGTEVVAQRVTLTNASVSDLRRANDRTQTNQGGPVDVVALTYQKIAIEDPRGGELATDEWTVGVSELEFEDAGAVPEVEGWLGETYPLENTGAGEDGPNSLYR